MKNSIVSFVFLSFATISFAHETHSYHCKYSDGDDVIGSREIKVSATSLTVKATSEFKFTWKGKLKKPTNESYQRYVGKIVNSANEYTPWYLVQDKLIDGEEQGYLEEINRGPKHADTTFSCTLAD